MKIGPGSQTSLRQTGAAPNADSRTIESGRARDVPREGRRSWFARWRRASAPFALVPLRWRVFIGTSITVTLLFAAAGWALQQYALRVTDQSVRAEVRASIQAYDAVWKARTQVLSATSALMGAMSDVRAAFATHDRETIRDSAQELWSRVSDASAVFLVLDAQGSLIAALGNNSRDLPVAAIPFSRIAASFPAQPSGYLLSGSHLFYIVLTPVYVQSDAGNLLLNVLCAGFLIDDTVARELKGLAPGSDFVFANDTHVFASTLSFGSAIRLSRDLASNGDSRDRLWQDRFIVSQRPLKDAAGKPIAELRIVHSYEPVLNSLAGLRRVLAIAWIGTIAFALLLSSYVTRRLFAPIQLLDRAVSQIAAGHYEYRVPVSGDDELARLGATFNNMCDSIERARAELIRQERLNILSRIGVSLVHDLRNPLAAIYGGSEMLIDGQLPAEQTERVARNIYRASQRVQELLRDLSSISRGERREAEPCNLHDIIDTAIENVNPAAAGVRVVLDVGDITHVFVDRSGVERVFTNLLSNAVEAMPEGGLIRIDEEKRGSIVDVFVTDTGGGIPASLRDQIFQPFATGKRTGFGLGLSLSKEMMKDLGGDLILIDGQGPGACFCVRLLRAGSVDTETKNQQEELSGPLTAQPG